MHLRGKHHVCIGVSMAGTNVYDHQHTRTCHTCRPCPCPCPCRSACVMTFYPKCRLSLRKQVFRVWDTISYIAAVYADTRVQGEGERAKPSLPKREKPSFPSSYRPCGYSSVCRRRIRRTARRVGRIVRRNRRKRRNATFCFASASRII